jgi:hypothetical protein
MEVGVVCFCSLDGWLDEIKMYEKVEACKVERGGVVWT